MFKVGLENYTVMGKHGAYDFEHQEEQPFVVSIWVELRNSSFDDKLENTINYAELQSLVDRVIIDSPPIRLMETMMVKITESIKQNPLVSKINIRIEKPKAALPKDGGLAIVESQWPY
ncbi:MAG: dihydroneopterin aldolase [Euryarchaeota archaeon]|jgi:dihydroneopterin aldolase|nr:dihydroneopterin aldolase [Euryarchaeota archaeon]